MSPEKWYDFHVKDTDYVPLDEKTRKLDLALPHGAKLCAMGLVLPDGEDEEEQLDHNQWMDIGKKLIEIDKGMQWALGTWWAFGRHKYGDRALAAKELKYKFGYLANLGRVARRVPPSCRSEVLSWSHHEKVAKLDPHTQQVWLNKATEQNWTCSTLEQKIKNAEKADRTEAEQRFEQDDPEGYRKEQSRKTANDAIYEFGKISANNDLNHAVQAITTDPQLLADLDDQQLARLKSAASREADKFEKAVSALEQEQERRATEPAKRRRVRERLPIPRAHL